MKVIQSGSGRLEVVNSSYLWGGLLALLGVGGFCQESFKFLYAQLNWRDFHADIPILISIVFMLIGLFLCQRYHAVFDRHRHELVWTLISPFGKKIRPIPLSKVYEADYEINANQIVNDHPKWGPMKRLIIRTEEENLPMAGLYTYGSASGDHALLTINKFLGRSAK